MKTTQFYVYQLFSIQEGQWGNASLENIIKVLESAIEQFYKNLLKEHIPNRKVIVMHSSLRNPPVNHPRFERWKDHNVIFLDTKDMFWAQYSYQFSHELCHHITDLNWHEREDKFGWIEEALCELASIFTLKFMATKWKTDPPYNNWIPFSEALNSYAEGVMQVEKDLFEGDFHKWLKENLNTLSSNRYDRAKNKIIAVQLYDVFMQKPKLWSSIQFLKSINIHKGLDLEAFLSEWQSALPENMKEEFENIKSVFPS